MSEVFSFSIDENSEKIICKNIDELKFWIDSELYNMDTGDKIIIQKIEMSEQEIESLPEFQGW